MKRLAVFGLAAVLVTVAACGRHKKVKQGQNPPPADDPNAQSSAGQGGFFGQDPQLSGGDPSQPAPSTPSPAAGSGTCQASCAHYLGCKGINNANTTQSCITRCAQLNKTQTELAQFEALACPAAIAAIEGPPRTAAPGGQGGAVASCPAPMAATRTPQDEQIFKALTTHRFCGFTYNQKTGVSRDMALVFAPTGMMRHGVKAETSISFNQGGSYYSNSASGTTYCWKYEGGLLLYSSDGSTFTNFVNKVEDNGNGVTFFQTKLGEYKACD